MAKCPSKIKQIAEKWFTFDLAENCSLARA